MVRGYERSNRVNDMIRNVPVVSRGRLPCLAAFPEPVGPHTVQSQVGKFHRNGGIIGEFQFSSFGGCAKSGRRRRCAGFHGHDVCGGRKVPTLGSQE